MRIEIEIGGEQERRLKILAREREIPVEEVVRLCLDEVLSHPVESRKDRYARAAKLIGAFSDPESATDLSTEHDRYLSD